jgi:hypothetical protein
VCSLKEVNAGGGGGERAGRGRGRNRDLATKGSQGSESRRKAHQGGWKTGRNRKVCEALLRQEVGQEEGTTGDRGRRWPTPGLGQQDRRGRVSGGARRQQTVPYGSRGLGRWGGVMMGHE